MAHKKRAATGATTGGSAEAPRIDFEKISSSLKNLEDRNHLDQIGPSVTDAYISSAKYTDDRGIVRYKTKFEAADAEKLSDKIYDELAYHIHHRYFNFDKDKLADLKSIKDAQGNAYMDTVVKYHLDLDRTTLKKTFKTRAENGDPIDHQIIGKMLEDKVQHHAQMITGAIVGDIGPNDMDALKAYIRELGERHRLDAKVLKRAEKASDIQSLIQQYMQIVSQNYSEPARDRPAA